MIKYLLYILRHKYYVMLECFKLGLIWRGLIHDISKFLPTEFIAYYQFFYGKGAAKDNTGYEVKDNKDENKKKNFDIAWLKHIHRNPHHWQYWMIREDSGGMKYMDMPPVYIMEMVADWQGASKALRGKNAKAINWYKKQKDKILLSENTRNKVEQLLAVI